MKNWLTIALILLFGTTHSLAQKEVASSDSTGNRLKLKSLNLTVKSGKANAEDYYNRGILNAYFGDNETALSDYSMAIQKNGKFDLAYINRGNLHQKQKHYELAEKDFNEAIRLDKSSSIAYNNRGFLYQNWLKLDEAIKDFNAAIKIDPTYPEPYMNLADVYLLQKNQPEAFATLDKMVAARSTDPKAYTSRSDAYRDAGMMRKALEDLDKAVEISGDDPDYIIERSKFKDDVIYDHLGAIEDCDLAIAKNPKNGNYYFQKSRPLYDLADYGSVLENCEKALELDPKHAPAMIMKANVLDMYKEHDEAKKLYLKAIALQPNEYDGYKQLSISQYALGKKKEAMSTLENYVNLGNSNKDIVEQHGKIAADLKQYEIALKDFNQLIEQHPSDPKYVYLRGLIQDSLGNPEAACNDMLAADKLGLNQAHQYLRVHCKSKLNAKTVQIEDMLDAAYALENQGRTQEAIDAYTNIIQIAPDSSVFYYNRGKAKRRLDNHAGAIEDYLKAINLDANKVEYIVSLGVSYSYLDKINEAKIAYEKAIEVDPSYAMSYFNLAGILAKQKNYEQAIELLETSLYYSPNYTKAMMGLGDCYMDLLQMSKACEWYKRAEKAGDDSAFGKRIRACA